jgi:hypothetical protein
MAELGLAGEPLPVEVFEAHAIEDVLSGRQAVEQHF